MRLLTYAKWKRLKLVANYGNPYVMTNVIIAVWSVLVYVRDIVKEHNLALHAHRAMHATFTRNGYKDRSTAYRHHRCR